MSLPQLHAVPRRTESELAFINGCITALQGFSHDERYMPLVLLVGYNADLVAALKPYARRIIVCDPHGPDVRSHSIRLRLEEPADMAILNLFHSATTNRWAPVHVMRDLLRRGVVKQFSGKGPYVVPRQSTTTLRVYEHPAGDYDDGVNRITWLQGLSNTDFMRPVTERVNVLYEQYCIPEQSWPSHITLQVPPSRHTLVAVLEWSVELYKDVYMTYLAMHRPDAKAARRLLQTGLMHFVWPQALGTTLHFGVAPKLTGGVQLTVKDVASATELKLDVRKMDLAIEKLFGVLVSS